VRKKELVIALSVIDVIFTVPDLQEALDPVVWGCQNELEIDRTFPTVSGK
jgi:hypothetical protein